MVRVRFHGRGGHGVKTSSRILGSAAFAAGFQVQDFPIYGAERRGAPVVAFTRFDLEPILERGPIAHPDLVIVADETLLGEAAAGVTAGAADARALFVNAAPESEHLPAVALGVCREIRSRHTPSLAFGEDRRANASRLGGGAPKKSRLFRGGGLEQTPEEASSEEPVAVRGTFSDRLIARDALCARREVALDLTSLVIEVLGRAASLSAGLAAAAARLSGVVGSAAVEQATRDELAELGVEQGEIDANVELARRVFEALPAIAAPPREVARAAPPQRLVHITYDGPIRGAPSILAAGNAAARRTGSWRVERPEIDRARCNACGLCFVRCPDGAMALDDEGYPIVDYDHCKGCLVCAQICPLDAVSRRREVRAW